MQPSNTENEPLCTAHLVQCRPSRSIAREQQPEARLRHPHQQLAIQLCRYHPSCAAMQRDVTMCAYAEKNLGMQCWTVCMPSQTH